MNHMLPAYIQIGRPKNSETMALDQTGYDSNSVMMKVLLKDVAQILQMEACFACLPASASHPLLLIITLAVAVCELACLDAQPS